MKEAVFKEMLYTRKLESIVKKMNKLTYTAQAFRVKAHLTRTELMFKTKMQPQRKTM